MFRVSLEDAQKTSSPQRTPTKQNSHSIQGQLLLGWVKKQGVNQAVNHGEVHPLWVMTHAGCITGGYHATCNSPLKSRPRLSNYFTESSKFSWSLMINFLGSFMSLPKPSIRKCFNWKLLWFTWLLSLPLSLPGDWSLWMYCYQEKKSSCIMLNRICSSWECSVCGKWVSAE